ncbi:MAG: choice-of-anchor D domain-containing protein, partial [Deltaproteobacteria bacterium]|nr:choice-of-anchor D domain-containing protein [Deltaproteobacteria bacterium]
RRKIILGVLISSLFGLSFCLIPASTRSIAEAGDTSGSGQIVFRGYIAGAGGSYPAADPAPDIDVSQENYDWGNLWVDFSDAEKMTITNVGTDSLTISGMNLSDTENFSFTMSGGDDPCGTLPLTIEAGASCTCLVEFHPQSEATYSAVLSIDSDDPDTPNLDVALTGTGVPDNLFSGDRDLSYSVNVGSGCSIVPGGGDGADGLGGYGLLVLAASWFGIKRRMNKTENTSNLR